ncbi:ABC transporter permease [Paenibacillus silviterrae]|uniref:ABC transporter permease n=1 Tax=Paenibacillus silviterrae TaxID=3242194 RepID=UPI002542B163|nr:ABC-2 family transporter protein [Paenibacillus chinjuensis]
MNSWHAFREKYRMLLQVEWSVMLAYRSESVIWMIGSFIQPLVSLSVWLSINNSGAGTGLSAKDYIVYFLGVLVVERLTRSWDVWELDSEIRQGTLSAKLLRPFHPIHWSIAQNLVYKSFFALLLIPAWIMLGLVWPMARPPADAVSLVLTLAAVLCSSVMCILIGYLFGMLAFWTNRATSIYMLYEGIHLFLAGRIAPLSLFPAEVARIASWLPFYSTVGFPVDLLTGRLAGQYGLIWRGFAVQAVWMLILGLLFWWLWQRGLRKYSAAGG